MTTYINNLLEGSINPGDANGLKIFTFATTERSKGLKITVRQDKASSMMTSFRQDSNSFG